MGTAGQAHTESPSVHPSRTHSVNIPAIKQHSLLWQISAGVHHPASYVFGTMHANLPVVFQRLEELKGYITECSAFAAEYSFDESMPEEMPPIGYLPPGMALDQLLRPHHYNRLRAVFMRYATLDIHPLRHLSPLFLTQLIDQRLSGIDGHPGSPLDYVLWEFAQQHDKILLGIETLESQVAVLQKIPLRQQVRNLLQLSRNIPAERRFFKHILELYVKGDPSAIYQATRRRSGTSRKFLLLHRNQTMAQQIGTFARAQSTFCAIGAAHLGGAKGVLRLLKHQGFEIKPIFCPQ